MAISTIQLARGKRSPGMWEEVSSLLQEDIIFGRLKPRERLVEDEIIARCSATRHAVRRAFDEIERLGLVVRQPNRGVQIRDYTLQEIDELYEVRDALEARAAVRMPFPVPHATIEMLSQIAMAHEKASEEERYVELFRLNNDFHEHLYAAAGNHHLAEAIKHYSFATHPIRSRGFADRDLRRTAVAEHWAMIATLKSEDRQELVHLCRRHIRRPMEFYVDANRLG